MRKKLGILAAASVFAAVPAAAAVSSTCGGASCTLAELAGGNTITVGEVVFSLSDYLDTGSLGIDASLITVTGVMGTDVASLVFAASPSLSVAGDFDFLGADFILDAAIVPMSSATMTAVGLSSEVDGLAIVGPGVSAVTFDINGDFLEVFDDSDFGELLSTSVGLSGLTSLSALGNLSLFGLATGSVASLSGFTFSVDLNGTTAPIPLPAALPMFLAGLAALRRRSNA